MDFKHDDAMLRQLVKDLDERTCLFSFLPEHLNDGTNEDAVKDVMKTYAMQTIRRVCNQNALDVIEEYNNAMEKAQRDAADLIWLSLKRGFTPDRIVPYRHRADGTLSIKDNVSPYDFKGARWPR